MSNAVTKNMALLELRQHSISRPPAPVSDFSLSSLLRRLRVAYSFQHSSIQLCLHMTYEPPLKRMLFDLTLENVMSRHIQLVDFAAALHAETDLRLVYVEPI